MTLRGCDISNHNGPPSAYRNQPWYQAAEFIIAQAIRPPQGYNGWEVGGYTEAQLRAAHEDGKKIGIYVWLWNSLANTTADIRARLALIPDDLKLDMRPWLDVEDIGANIGPSRQQDVLDALEVMDEWATSRGLPPAGIYSGAWYLNDYMDGWFPEGRVYWLADYGLAPEVMPMRPVHQYTSDPVDMNVMLESEIVEQQTGDTPPVTDVDQGCEGLIRGLAYVADDLGDKLLVEAKRSSVRKTVVRQIVAEMGRVRLEQVGPRPT